MFKQSLFKGALTLLMAGSIYSAQGQINGSSLIYEVGDNVGIGTSNPGERLQIGNSFTFHDGGNIVLGFNYDPWKSQNPSGLIQSWYDDDDKSGYKYGASIRFMPYQGILNFGLSWEQGKNIDYPTMSLTWDKKVGIGIQEPESRLHIKRDNSQIKFLGKNNLENFSLLVDLNNKGVDFDVVSAQHGFNFSNSTGQLMNIDKAGNVVIGNTSGKTGYKLSVDGFIVCEELMIQMAVDWGDFVFEEDYSLLSLEETESYIQKNKHLPGIPSAEEIYKNGGISSGEMHRLQMIEIEELTLHIIELNNKNKSLNADHEAIAQDYTSLKARQEKLEEENRQLKEDIALLKQLLVK